MGTSDGEGATVGTSDGEGAARVAVAEGKMVG